MDLSIHYLPAELRAAMRFHLSGNVRRKIEIVVGLLLFGMGATCLALFGYAPSFVGLLFITPFLIFSPVWMAWIGWLSYRKEPLYRNPFDLSFREDGILYTSPMVNSKMEWPIFKKWRENGQFFLLYYGPNLFVSVPKRFFPEAAQIDRFRDLITARIPAQKP